MGDRELWERARSGLETSDRPGDDEAALLIAGYVEGRLTPGEQLRVEAWLATDEAALELMLDTQAALAAELEPAPPAGLVSRAEGLVRPRPVAGAERSGWLERLFGGFGGGLQPIGLAAALALAVAVGAGMGHSSYVNLMAAQSLLAEGDSVLADDDFL